MRRIAVVVLVLVMAACGSDSSEVADSPDVTTGSVSTVEETPIPGSSAAVPSTSTSPGTTPPVASSTTVEPSEEDLVVFIAAMEELLGGTVYEGEAINEPELFLATGWLFCDWLDEGDEPDVVLSRYLDELAGGVDAATDDQLVLAGALLGAAVGVLCPVHAAAVG
jgi:hypothetical protein